MIKRIIHHRTPGLAELVELESTFSAGAELVGSGLGVAPFEAPIEAR